MQLSGLLIIFWLVTTATPLAKIHFARAVFALATALAFVVSHYHF